MQLYSTCILLPNMQTFGKQNIRGGNRSGVTAENASVKPFTGNNPLLLVLVLGFCLKYCSLRTSLPLYKHCIFLTWELFCHLSTFMSRILSAHTEYCTGGIGRFRQEIFAWQKERNGIWPKEQKIISSWRQTHLCNSADLKPHLSLMLVQIPGSFSNY